MIDASKFAKPAIQPGGDSNKFFRFGLRSNAEVAKELRDFADAIERGEVALQTVQSGIVTKLEDWTLHAIYLEYAPKD